MSQLNNEVYSNIFSAIEVLGMYLPRVKGIFSRNGEMLFSLGLILLRFSCFRKCQYRRDQRSQFNNDTFSKVVSAMEILVMYLPFT